MKHAYNVKKAALTIGNSGPHADPMTPAPDSWGRRERASDVTT